MTWTTWKPALALGAVLAATGAASTDDRDTRQLAGSTGTTMTLGGKGTAQQAATEDTELARGYRYYGGHGYHGHYGYRGGYGYYGGYRGGYYGGYYGGYRGYYGGYYGGYRPAYYYTPRVYYSNYYYPTYYPTYYGGGFYIGIGGNSNDATAVNLGGIGSRPVSQPVPTAGDSTFPYDGGPTNPVPLPKADPQMNPPANPSAAPADLPVSFKPKPATSPYKYKAYGEK